MFSGYRTLLWVALAGLFPFADSAPPNPIQFTDVTGAAGIKFVHFNAETVEVQWPSGQHQVFRNVEADRFYLIEKDDKKWVNSNCGVYRCTWHTCEDIS